jgi:hypothetical protein
MSVLPPKAGIAERDQHVRFVPKADILRCSRKKPRQYVFTYTKALSPVIALPTINVFISRVPS